MANMVPKPSDDAIWIRNLEIDCIVGVLKSERTRRRKVVATLRLSCDLAAAGLSDDLADTVDYRRVQKLVEKVVRANPDFLIERMAQRIADAALSFPGITGVTVWLSKPDALPRCETVEVEITRHLEKPADRGRSQRK